MDDNIVLTNFILAKDSRQNIILDLQLIIHLSWIFRYIKIFPYQLGFPFLPLNFWKSQLLRPNKTCKILLTTLHSDFQNQLQQRNILKKGFNHRIKQVKKPSCISKHGIKKVKNLYFLCSFMFKFQRMLPWNSNSW